MPTSRRRPGATLALALLTAVTATSCSSVGGAPTAAGPVPATPASPVPSSSTSPASPSVPPSSSDPVTGGPTNPSAAPDAGGTVGSAGIGDPYYPTAGNGGYQVDHYDVNLTYDPASNDLTATTTITGSVTADQGLSRFNLDLQPNLTVGAVTVNDTAGTFAQDGAELVITPAAELAAGAPLTVAVTYTGRPQLVGGGTAGLGDGGWFRTDTGGAFAAGEPTGASTWYPVNEHPRDTATFAVTATVPDGWQVISNGIRSAEPPAAPAGWTASRWELDTPVASYLSTIYIDKFTFVEGTLSDGRPIVSAISPGAPASATDLARRTGPVVDVLSQLFGPYPMPAAGGIFIKSTTGFALETATRPVYTTGVDDLSVVVHELAHQWYGDDVTVASWADICLNECFASYAEWLYAEKVAGRDLDSRWKQTIAGAGQNPQYWSSPLVDMGPGREFTRVYDRGPIALHALRKEIGDDTFFRLLQQWPATFGGRNASFDDFEAFVNQLAGRDLTAFIDAWFRSETRPPPQYLYPGELGG